MPMILETRDAIFELRDSGTGDIELKKIKDMSGGVSKFKEGMVLKGKYVTGHQYGGFITLYEKEGGKLLFKSGKVVKPPQGNPRA